MEEQNKQKLLNKLLRGTLLSEHNIDTVNILLDKGADPKYLNDLYDFAFHLREFIKKNKDSVGDVEFLIIRLFDGGFSKIDPSLIEGFVRNGFYTALCRSLEIKHEEIENDIVVYDDLGYKSVKTRFSDYLFDYVLPTAFEYPYPDMLSFIIRKYSMCSKKVFKRLYESKRIDNKEKEQLYELLYEKLKSGPPLDSTVRWGFENKDYKMTYMYLSGKHACISEKHACIIDYAFNEYPLYECKMKLLEYIVSNVYYKHDIDKFLEEKVQHCKKTAAEGLQYLIFNKFVESDRAIDNVLLWAAINGNNDILEKLLEKRLGGKAEDKAEETETNEDYEVIEHIKKHGSLPSGVKFVPNE